MSDESKKDLTPEAILMDGLPSDVLGVVLSKLDDLQDLTSAMLSCKAFRDAAARDDDVWENAVISRVRALYSVDNPRRACSNLYGSSGSRVPFVRRDRLPLYSLPHGDRWRGLGRALLRTERNWEGMFQSGRTEYDRYSISPDFIRCLELDSSDDLVVACSGSTQRLDIGVHLLNLRTGDHRVLRGHTKPIWTLRYDGRLIFTGAEDGTVRVWDADPDANRCLVLRVDNHPVHCLSVNSDQGGDTLVASTNHEFVSWPISELFSMLQQVEEGPPGQPATAVNGPGPASSSYAFFKDVAPLVQVGTRIAAVGYGTLGRCEIYGPLEGSVPFRSDPLIYYWPGCIVIDGEAIEATRMRRINTLSVHDSEGILVASSSGSDPPVIEVYDLEKRAARWRFECLEQVTAHQLAGNLLAWAEGRDCSRVKLYDIRAPSQLTASLGVYNGIDSSSAIALDPSRHVLAVNDSETLTHVLDLRKASRPHAVAFRAHEARPWAIAMDHRRIVSGGLDGNLCVREFSDMPPPPNKIRKRMTTEIIPTSEYLTLMQWPREDNHGSDTQ